MKIDITAPDQVQAFQALWGMRLDIPNDLNLTDIWQSAAGTEHAFTFEVSAPPALPEVRGRNAGRPEMSEECSVESDEPEEPLPGISR